MTSEQSVQPSMILALQEDVTPAECTLILDVITIGRSPLCQIIIARQLVSRLHAKIKREGPRYWLSDEGSANGTFVNGQRLLEPHLLKDRDGIGLGELAAVLRFADPDPTFVRVTRLRYDESAMLFFVHDQPLTLTPAQFRLLLLLYQQAGAVCSRADCATAIWGRSYEPGMDADALDRALSSLRSLLRRVDPTAEFIETRRGLGYVLHL